jgi:flagellar biosynthetic protein FliP
VATPGLRSAAADAAALAAAPAQHQHADAIEHRARRPRAAGDVSVAVQIVLLMTLLSVAPSIVLLMTSFTRIVIVLGFVRTALGTPSAPSNQIVVGLSLFLTFFLMGPVVDRMPRGGCSPTSTGRSPRGGDRPRHGAAEAVHAETDPHPRPRVLPGAGRLRPDGGQ